MHIIRHTKIKLISPQSVSVCVCLSYLVGANNIVCSIWLPVYSLTTGRFKKMPEFSCITKIVVTCKPCNGITNCFSLMKTKIHLWMLNTEPFLWHIRGLRYLKNKIWLWNRQIQINTGWQLYLRPYCGLRIPQMVPDRPLIHPE